MPELPEAEIVRRGLAEILAGTKIEGLEVFHPRTARYQNGGSAQLTQQLSGAHLDAVVRRGKFMWTLTSNGQALMMHLGMSGQFRPLAKQAGEAPVRHERARLYLSGGPAQSLSFIDQRTFGALYLSPTANTEDGAPAGCGSDSLLLPAGASHIARDLLDPHLDLVKVNQRIRKSKSPIKNVLLNQSIISGFGNIYADEALFVAGVHGARSASTLTRQQVAQILQAGIEIMERSLSRGGTSFDQLYVDVNGSAGTFADELLVYGRAGQACRECGHELSSISLNKRSHVYCANCQRPPRNLK
ncbi:DNA-formamidopyrimidine glycosylase [Boudabousia liubingyangii]|uniref:bifunctional DNA-formamidopyrimidine glycosylase/DNA-(apurinic or apyrimidinic site) lyase n=1 Tax=Boudabousia liubingyangii TaxID=1921764 RepID=UPI00093CA576|nr:bifunctional DNA-formamidopyrimidine glycosylase/DNA-(apurinic or apyrimidinic site) lyase [Boudabousia liubingyangii]OKL47572.1 DNA-formamidopyrimidine glycosylase [Boudabousia liubingyangii]